MSRRVRLLLDMNEEDSQLLEDEDSETLTLDEIIRSRLETAARIVELNADHHLLDGGTALSGSMTFDKAIGKGRGRMALPDDFLRLVTFKMSDWRRAVTEAIPEEDPRYDLQSSRHAGIRGTPERPVCALIQEPSGLTLEFWSCTGGSTVTLQRGRYLKKPKIAGDNIDICEKLYDAIVAKAASLTAATLGETARAELLEREAAELMK